MIICQMHNSTERTGKNGYFCSILCLYSHPHIQTTLRLAVLTAENNVNIPFRSKTQ